MKRFLQYLREFTFADLHPKPGEWKSIPTSVLKKAQREPSPNIDTELFDLLDKSYAYIGGHVDFQKASDIPANHTIWYAVDLDGDGTPEAVKFGKETSHGIKWTGGASDGQSQSKQTYVQTTVDLLMKPGNCAEVSDAIMHILISRYQVPHVKTQDEVEDVIGKPVKWIGKHPQGKYPGYEGFYERALGGANHMKILLGKPL